VDQSLEVEDPLAHFIADVYSGVFKLRQVATTREIIDLTFDISKCLIEYAEKNNVYAARWVALKLSSPFIYWDATRVEVVALDELRKIWNAELRK
jgi:hypothetical protein